MWIRPREKPAEYFVHRWCTYTVRVSIKDLAAARSPRVQSCLRCAAFCNSPFHCLTETLAIWGTASPVHSTYTYWLKLGRVETPSRQSSRCRRAGRRGGALACSWRTTTPAVYGPSYCVHFDKRHSNCHRGSPNHLRYAVRTVFWGIFF